MVALLLAQPLITQTSHFNQDTSSHCKLIFPPFKIKRREEAL
jgi:hypothetical protein